MEKASAYSVYQKSKKKTKKNHKKTKLGEKPVNGVLSKKNKKLKMKQIGLIKEMIKQNDGNQSDDSEPPMLVEIKSENSKTTASIKKTNNTNNSYSKDEKLKKKRIKPTHISKNAGKSSDSSDDSSSDEEDYKVKQTTPSELFKWMISPVASMAFFKENWEKKPLHVKRGSEGYNQSLFPSNFLDQMIRDNVLLYGKHLDVVTYENGVRETYNPHDGRAVATAVWDFYANGCSVRIKNPQTYCLELRTALMELQEYFGSYVGVNLYLTPKGSQGFAPHWDDIEAFVVQLEGRKHWKLYNPKNSGDVLSRISSPNLTEEQLGSKIMECTVEEGDLLYFPRGTVHQARTDEECHSLHLTISVYQRTSYADLLEQALPAALKEMSEKDVNFRKGLPRNYLKHLGESNKDKKTTVRDHIMSKVQKLVDKLFTSNAVDAAADQLGQRLMEESLPHFPTDEEYDRTCHGDGDMLVDGEVINRTEFNLDTEVRLLRYYSVRMVKDEEGTKLYYTSQNGLEYSEDGGKFLTLNPEHVPVVKALLDFYPKFCAIEDFPSDSSVTVDVVSDLWELGLIITKEPLVSYDDSDL